MAFKVYEVNGVWAVGQDSADLQLPGVPIGYDMYQQLKNVPHEACNYFQRDSKNKIVLLKQPKKP